MRNQRDKFSIPKGVTYLNCASMAPLLKSVERAGIAGIQRKRNPFEILAEDFFNDGETLREEYAKVINVADSKRIAIIPSVSYGMANVSRNVRLASGDNIIVAGEQFPSNYYPWHARALETGATLKAVDAPETVEHRGRKWNERILEAIDAKTKIVSIGNVHWTDGTRFDLEPIRKRTRDVGSLLIIDGTQSVGALPFDVQRIQPDALVCAAYKWLMGPYAFGLAYYGPYFDNGKPIEESWLNRIKSEDFKGLVNYQDDYQPGSLRYDVGERSNFIMVPMMQAALKEINKWKPENIQRYCQSISKKAIEVLGANGYQIEDETYRGHHIFGIRFPKGTSLDLVREKIRKKRISISFRGDSMRVSCHVFNSADDFEKLLNALDIKYR
jgi:selenocysteine lyase/cysteine desulfurase